MVQLADGLHLGHEPSQGFGLTHATGVKFFQGHPAMQAPVPRLVDHAHAAAAKLLEDLVVAQHLGSRRRFPL